MKTKDIVIGALILYIAFTPGFQMMRDILATSIGKVLALGIVVTVWRKYDSLVALLLLVAYLHCGLLTRSVSEMFDVPAVACTCPGDMTYDQATNKCKNAKGETKDPIACSCPSGYAYDGVNKKCIQNSEMSEPIPAVTSEAAPALPADPTKTGPPMTTPGAAQEAAATTTATQMAGPTPSTTEKFVGYSLY